MLYRISVTERGLTGIANIFRSRLSKLDDLLGAGTVPLRQVLLGGGGSGPPPVFFVSALCLATSFFAFNLTSFHFFFNSSVVRIMAVEACSSAWIDFQTSALVAEPFPGPENFPSTAYLCVSTQSTSISISLSEKFGFLLDIT